MLPDVQMVQGLAHARSIARGHHQLCELSRAQVVMQWTDGLQSLQPLHRFPFSITLSLSVPGLVIVVCRKGIEHSDIS